MKILKIARVLEIISTGNDVDMIINTVTGDFMYGLKIVSKVIVYTDVGKKITRDIPSTSDEEERLIAEYLRMMKTMKIGNVNLIE